MTNKWSWAAEKRGMERSFNFITGNKTKIIDILPPDDSLGFTSKDKTIHLAYEHPAMDGLSDDEKVAFRKGVFCHEMLHQVFTDFNALEKALLGLSGPERRILSMISNVLEDPAIEYWAPSAVSGPLLKALRFTIAHIYKDSPNIEESDTAFGQYVSALIQFGDMGLLKGRFTFPEAKKAFADTADIFEKGVTEPIAEKRMDYAKQIFEISRPLWQDELEREKALQELAEMLSELGKSAMTGSGHGQDGDPSSAPNTKKDRRRKVTIKKVSKEEMEELKKNSESGSGDMPEDADVTVYVCDEDESPKNEDSSGNSGVSVPVNAGNEEEKKEETTSSGSSTASGSDSDGEGKEKKTEEMKEVEDSENESSSMDSTNTQKSDENASEKKEDGDNADSESSGQTDGDGEPDGDSSPIRPSKDNPYKRTKGGCLANALQPDSGDIEDEDGDCSVHEDEYQIDEEDLAAILSEVESDVKACEKEAELTTDNSAIPDYDIASAKMPRKSCLNYRITFTESERPTLEKAYSLTLSKMAVGIHTTTKVLKRIFEDDKEEREYRCSGNISLKRLYGGTVTDRIFEKKISPANKSNLVVEILVDESGSMEYNGKYLAARDCCIALAEIFHNLNVPVYVMGFTADSVGYDVVHSHYITWKNTKDDRLKLLNISARANNCDGASIRYASEVIKNKQAQNKLLIVISDGRPVAHNYYQGDADTKDAIRNAKKYASVLGVAVGNNDTEKIQYFYEKDFLHVSNVDELFGGIAKAIKRIIKSW